MILYTSTVDSYFEYCMEFWSPPLKIPTEKLKKPNQPTPGEQGWSAVQYGYRTKRFHRLFHLENQK